MNKCKKYVIVLLVLIMLINSLSVFSANVDTGGGSMGGNTDSTKFVFSSGDFGVRFTIVDAKTGSRSSKSTDFYKKNNKDGKTLYHYDAASKIEYKKGKGLSGKKDGYNEYSFYCPELWNVIESSFFGSKASLSEIELWLKTDTNLKKVSTHTNFKYKDLTNGDYCLIAEPVFYFTYDGIYYAMTAHEISLSDELLGGDIRRRFGTYSHKNIPLSLFLKKKRFGIGTWTGSKTQITTNNNIKNYLGIAIMTWPGVPDDVSEDPPPVDKEPDPDPEVDITTADYVYRSNTEVITSVDIRAIEEASPDNPIRVQFNIPNVGIRVVDNILIPKGYTQKVWVKWKTPDNPQKIIIDVTSSSGSVKGKITCQIKNLGYTEPINPRGEHKERPKDFNIKSDPTKLKPSSINKVEQLVWTRWERCVRESEIVGYRNVVVGWLPNGTPIMGSIPIYEYYWHFGTGTGRTPGDPTYYYANINNTVTELTVTPDENLKRSQKYKDKMKSGYGISAKLNVKLSTNDGSSITQAQTGIFYFPEFNYQKYSRIAEYQKISGNGVLTLPVNYYSIKLNKVHFTPLWFPDGPYKLYVKYYDIWTPAGMLQSYETDILTIEGTLWEDWHIGPIDY